MSSDLSAILKRSRRMVFFGGAGVSTESGIPDFRSQQGLFAARTVFGRRPEELISRSFFLENPSTFFAYYRENLLYPTAKPGPAHTALATLEKMGHLQAVVTQNIDGLHQQAGSTHVLELHGSVARNYCTGCGARYSLGYMLSPQRQRDSVPLCTDCGGIVRPDVVLYEEALNNEVVQKAVEAIARADALVVGGTSLAVYPANSLIQYYRGDNLVLINRSETPLDSQATLVIRDSIGQVLEQALQGMAET